MHECFAARFCDFKEIMKAHNLFQGPRVVLDKPVISPANLPNCVLALEGRERLEEKIPTNSFEKSDGLAAEQERDQNSSQDVQQNALLFFHTAPIAIKYLYMGFAYMQ